MKAISVFGPKLSLGLALALVVAVPPIGGVAQEAPQYQNLQVLPENISRSELTDIMLTNLSGLGLPRRANRGCLFCHVGSMDVPASEWDWASDENPMKLKAPCPWTGCKSHGFTPDS